MSIPKVLLTLICPEFKCLTQIHYNSAQSFHLNKWACICTHIHTYLYTVQHRVVTSLLSPKTPTSITIFHRHHKHIISLWKPSCACDPPVPSQTTLWMDLNRSLGEGYKERQTSPLQLDRTQMYLKPKVGVTPCLPPIGLVTGNLILHNKFCKSKLIKDFEFSMILWLDASFSCRITIHGGQWLALQILWKELQPKIRVRFNYM